MKIVVISNQAFSLVNFRGSLMRKWRDMGITVVALAPDYDDDHRRLVKDCGAEPMDFSMARTGMNPWHDVLDVFKLVKLLRKIKADISFSYFIKPVIYGNIAARMAGIKRRYSMIEGAGWVYSSPGNDKLSKKLLRLIVSYLYRLGLSGASGVFFLNDGDIELFKKKKMVNENIVGKISGIGVDLDAIKACVPKKEPVTFILMARLLGEKGVREYVNAARIIKSDFHAVRFILLGNLDSNPTAIPRNEVEAWVAEGLIEWPGHVADVYRWLSDASVFVLPSYYREGLPRSTQEAMASGLPVITTNFPGCRETVMDGRNGFLVPIKDVNALVLAMKKFIERPDLIALMGAESRKMAEERFDAHLANERICRAMGLN